MEFREVEVPARYYPPGGSPRESWRTLYYANLTANFASEVLGEIEGNEGNFDDGLWVQEVINAVEISHHERRWVSLPLDAPLGATESQAPVMPVNGHGALGHHRHREHRPRGVPARPAPGRRRGGGGGRPGRRPRREVRQRQRHRPRVAGYQTLIDDPDIDALYIPLPNALHAEWTIRALEAGKPVLCEKPLCGKLPDTERVLAAARQTGTLLWEAFVVPVPRAAGASSGRLVADGAIGELMEIKSNFHFTVSNPANIRLSRELEGGALHDVGCYPVRLAAGAASARSTSRPGRGLGRAATASTWTPGGCSATRADGG